jgi:hypothetical protein
VAREATPIERRASGEEALAETLAQVKAMEFKARAEKMRAAAEARREAQARRRPEEVEDAAAMLQLFVLEARLGQDMRERDKVLQVAGERWRRLNGPERVAAMRRTGLDAWRCAYVLGALAAMHAAESDIEVGARLATALRLGVVAPGWVASGLRGGA